MNRYGRRELHSLHAECARLEAKIKSMKAENERMLEALSQLLDAVSEYARAALSTDQREGE